MKRVTGTLAVAALLLVGRGLTPLLAAGDYFVDVGSYTAATSKGIYAWRLTATAVLTSIGLAAGDAEPRTSLASPNGRFLYAVNWQGNDTVRRHGQRLLDRGAATGALRLEEGERRRRPA